MANGKVHYIEKAYSISKQGYFDPWKIEFINPLDATTTITVFIENQYADAGSTESDIPVIIAGEDLTYILDYLLEHDITAYPYQWPLEGQKIDEKGYDFYCDSTTDNIPTFLEVVQSAKTIIWEKCNIQPPEPEYESSVTKEEFVKGTFLSKFSVKLGKASPVSSLSLNLHTTKPMELLSIVYESDITSYSDVKKLNMEYVTVNQDNYTLFIRLAKPIFARRLTFVLAQNNAEQNSYQVVNYVPESRLYGVETEEKKTPFTSIASQWGSNQKSEKFLLSKEEFANHFTGMFDTNKEVPQVNYEGNEIRKALDQHNTKIRRG